MDSTVTTQARCNLIQETASSNIPRPPPPASDPNTANIKSLGVEPSRRHSVRFQLLSGACRAAGVILTSTRPHAGVGQGRAGVQGSQHLLAQRRSSSASAGKTAVPAGSPGTARSAFQGFHEDFLSAEIFKEPTSECNALLSSSVETHVLRGTGVS